MGALVDVDTGFCSGSAGSGDSAGNGGTGGGAAFLGNAAADSMILTLVSSSCIFDSGDIGGHSAMISVSITCVGEPIDLRADIRFSCCMLSCSFSVVDMGRA